MATKIQLRRDTASDWTSTNPTLAAGEFGWESDTNRFKIGDGATAWTSLAYASDGDTAGITFVGDDSTGTLVSQNETFKVAGTQNVTTAVSGDTLTVTGPDLSSYATGSSTTTFTNKTFDANGTGNSISNIETADIAAGTLVTAAEGIGSNNNDTTIPTSAAVKAYADSVGGGGTITALNNQAENRLVSIGATTTELDGEANLTFDGSTLSLTGSAALDGVTIADNLITTNRSNDDLTFGTNGTGRIKLSADGSDFFNNPLYETFFGGTGNTKTLGISSAETVDANTAVRNYPVGVSQNTTLSGSSSSNSGFNQRTMSLANSMDMAGYSFTQASDGRGPVAGSFGTNVVNSGTTASTLYRATGASFTVGAYDEGSFSEGDVTITDAVATQGFVELYSGGSGSGNFTFTNAYNFKSKTSIGANDTITNQYGFYHSAPGGSGTITNQYAFYDATNSLSVFGDIQTQAVSITDNLITTNRSNDDLNIEANGTGQVQIRANGGDFANFSTLTRYNDANILYWEDLNHTIANDRSFKNNVITNIKLAAGQDTANSNDRWRQIFRTVLDLNGSSTTPVSSTLSRGPMGIDSTAEIRNTASGTTSRLGNASGNQAGVLVDASAGNISFEAADSSTTNAGVAGNMTYVELLPGSGQTITIPTAINFYSTGIVKDGAGTASITDSYAFYAKANPASSSITNEYGFYTADDSMINSIGGVTLQNGDVTTGAITLSDNLITTNRSNDSLFIGSNGTGLIELSTDGGQLGNSPTYPKYHFSPSQVKGVVLSRETSTNIDALTSRQYGHVLHYGTTVTNGSTNNSNWTPRSVIFSSHTNMDGESYTNASNSRGPVGLFTAGTANNSSGSSASTLYNLRASVTSAGIADYDGSPTQNMTIDRCIATESAVMIETTGTSTNTITDAYNFYSSGYIDAAAGNTNTITNLYGFYHGASHGTNDYAFYDATNSLSRFGAVILANQAGDPSGVADSAHIYAKDVASSSEVFVRDEAGNVTQISPHNEAGEWQYWSENIKTGKKVRVNMERMIRRLEEITGETFIENE